MCYGVSQVEFAALATLALIALDDARLDSNRHQHQVSRQQRIAAHLVKGQSLNHFEQHTIAEQTRLDQFGQTGTELTIGERAQHSDVAQHKFGLVETADHILVAVEIDAILATHAGINLSEQCRRNKSESHTAHKCRCDESRDVGHNAAADTEQEGLSVSAAFDQFAVELLDRRQSLNLLARTDDDVFVLIDQAAVATSYRGVGDDDNTVSPRQKRMQIVFPTAHNDAAHQFSVA